MGADIGHWKVLLTGLSILCIAGERAKAVFTTCFLDSDLGDLLGHGRGTTLGRGCRLGLHGFGCLRKRGISQGRQTRSWFDRLTASVLSILSLIGVETLHVVVELLLARLLEPDLSNKARVRWEIWLWDSLIPPEFEIIKLKIHKNGKLMKLNLL